MCHHDYLQHFHPHQLMIISEVRMAASKVVAILGEMKTMMIMMNHGDDDDDGNHDDNDDDNDDTKVGRVRRGSLV